jgi:hypothetical protein
LLENERLIENLRSDISSLQNQMHANQEKLQRLRQAKAFITNDQEELSAHKKLISDPDLSPSTWAGRHATEFLNIRTDIEHSYTGIITHQVEDILLDIEEKISQLESENSSFSNSIASKNYRISQL